MVTKNPLDRTRKPGSIGSPIPHVEVSIQDETGRTLGANETGEVCVKGGNVMQGPEKTRGNREGNAGRVVLTGTSGIGMPKATISSQTGKRTCFW